MKKIIKEVIKVKDDLDESKTKELNEQDLENVSGGVGPRHSHRD